MIANPTFATFEAFVAPMIELNKIALGYTEKLTERNLASLRKQADVALTSWREALAVNDPEAAKTYLAHQGEVARDVVKEYVAEAKAITELNQAIAEDVRKVVEASLAKVTKRAA